MEEDDGAAAIQLGVHRLERRVVQGLPRHRAAQRHADHAERVQTALQLGERRVDVRQRQAGEGGEASAIFPGGVGVDVIGQAGRRYGLRRSVQVRLEQGDGQHLAIDADGVEDAGLLVQVARTAAHPRGRLGHRMVQAFQTSEILVGKVVRVDVDTHPPPSLASRYCATRPSLWSAYSMYDRSTTLLESTRCCWLP